MVVLTTGVAACLAACGPVEESDSALSPPPAIETVALGAEAESWEALTVLRVVDPRDHGATGDGQSDDTGALQAAIDSLAEEGGVVLFDRDTMYRTSDVVRIGADHIKMWAPDGGGGIVADTAGADRRQALIVDGASSVGLFGLEFRSTANRRLTALEDSAVVLDGTEGAEVVGLDIANSASAAVFVYGGSTSTFVTGNTIHHSWADAVHFTDGARNAWVWDNQFFTEAPWLGDDGVACVTYGSGPRCGGMEWWNNVHLGSGWGRGFAVVGGDDIDIHSNVVRGTGAAGILVASEPSYDTAGSQGIRIRDNTVVDVGHAIPHPGILISGLEEPISDVSVTGNVVVSAAGSEAFRAEGNVEDVRHNGTATFQDVADVDLVLGPTFLPTTRSTVVMATRDPSLVADDHRPGLQRVQVRRGSRSGEFQQRFEYVVAGQRRTLRAWQQDLAGVSARFCLLDPSGATDQDECYLVARVPVPSSLPAGVRAVSFPDLRSVADKIPGLWSHIDEF